MNVQQQQQQQQIGSKSQSQQETKYQRVLEEKNADLIYALTQCFEASAICSVKAIQEGRDCFKCCKAVSELSETAMKWVLMGNMQYETDMVQLVSNTCLSNSRMCGKHQSIACQNCARACAHVHECCKEYLQKANKKESK